MIFRKNLRLRGLRADDNVSELTARTNDEGWATVFSEWLKGSRINSKDGLLIFFRRRWQPGKKRQPESRQRDSTCQKSWRGGDRHCRTRRRIHGEGSDGCVIVPTVNPTHVTPHSEAFQGIVWICSCRIRKLKSRADEMGIHKIICRSRGNEAQISCEANE